MYGSCYSNARICNKLLLFFSLIEGNRLSQTRPDDLNSRSDKITDQKICLKPEKHIMVKNRLLHSGWCSVAKFLPAMLLVCPVLIPYLWDTGSQLLSQRSQFMMN